MLEVTVHYPDPNAPTPPPVQEDPKAKGKGAPAVVPPPELSFKVSLPLVHLIFRQRRPEVEGCFDALARASGCAALRGLRLGVTCSGPILSEDVVAHLNPMLVTIDGVHKLPDEPELGQTKEAVKAVLHAFGEERATAPARLNERGKVSFASHSVFFVGTWRQSELREYLQTESLSVEVHDRGDPSASSTEKRNAKPVPFGLAHFKLGDLAGKNAGYPRSLRAAVKPALKQGKSSHLGNGQLKADILCGAGASDLLDSIGALSYDFVPRYLESGSYVTLTLQLMRELRGSKRAVAAEEPPPLEETQKTTRYEKFARLVLVSDYRKTTMMKRLVALVNEVNTKALGLDASKARSLVNIELSAEQRADTDFDVLTGFCVMDRYTRITVVEGLREGAMTRVTALLEAGSQRQTDKFKLLFHPDVGFSDRLYLDFNLSIKQIKLRQSRLESLLQRPALYDREREDKEVPAALIALMDMKRVPRLHMLKGAGSFPPARAVAAIETQYGDFVADEEMEGGRRADDGRSTKSGVRSQRSTREGGSATRSCRTPSEHSKRTGKEHAEHAADDNDEESDVEDEEIKMIRNQRVTLKAALDSKNLTFLATLEERAKQPQASMIVRNIDAVKTISEEKSKKTPRAVVDMSFMESAPVHIYSQQALNSAELQKRALRAKMQGKEGDQLWTYKSEFNSGCFPMLEKDVDLGSVLRQAVPHEDDREPWRYPRPREKADYRKHELMVSEARREELACPWKENELRPELDAKEVIKGGFDMKTLGTGGAHVISVRRPGHQDLAGTPAAPPPPPPQRREPAPMRFSAGYASMGLQSSLDKYNRTILDGAPASKGLCFEARKTPRNITQKFGKTQNGRNVACPPISFNLEERFEEPNRGNSEYPHQFSARLARPVVARPLASSGEDQTRKLGGTTTGPLSARNQYREAGSKQSKHSSGVGGGSRQLSAPDKAPLSAR
eukprot:TRINITY_DN9246_c1_g2_i3.p1 TRINITY_DN9246_c1_g2~~TRINITY_DN9246_c1_g2_i3.p1  ORF type:complete len:1032 (+),score=199.60 TRINITY_DN9246_c1_g2_i3:222-3098(+)